MAEFVTKMHHPLGEYFFWALASTSLILAFGPTTSRAVFFPRIRETLSSATTAGEVWMHVF